MKKLLRNTVKFFAKLYYKACSKKCDFSEFIPVSGKVLDENELVNMIDASLDMWLTSGRFNKEFERKLAAYLGSKYALTVNSGSSANLLALSALTSPKLGERRLKKGDEVITVAAGFPTTINPIMQNGMVPVFVDCELDTYNVDTNKIEEAITEKTKAVIFAHTLGTPFELNKVKEICDKYKLWLIEDSCDALGAEYNGKYCGTVGDIGTFSFYPAHHITMGEGGAVVTDNSQLAKIMKSFRDWGRDCWCDTGKDDTCKHRFSRQYGNLPNGYDHKYIYSHMGYNLKITDWQAAIGLAQLDKLDTFLEIRRSNAKYLYSKLEDLQEFITLPKLYEGSSWFGFLLSVNPQKINKFEMIKYLENNGVGTRQLFSGNILRHPMFIDSDISFRIGSSDIISAGSLNEDIYKLLPNTDYIMQNTFWVGVYHGLNTEALDKISNVIHKYIGEIL